MGVTKAVFGKAKTGEEVFLYTITNTKGMVAKVTDFGATLVSLLVPDAQGNVEDVVLGFDSAEGYHKNGSFFGATIGPSANRIANASFELEGITYQLPVNDGPNNLHSDHDFGYHKLVWNTEIGENEVKFYLEDADGNMGFPGNKSVSVTYTLTEDNELKLHYYASVDKQALLNLTNHTYFNLNGHKSGKIEDTILMLKASSYTPVVAGAIPTGEIATVKGTPLDFTTAKPIGQDINADCEQLKLVQGYDHNFVIDDADGTLKEIAVAKDPVSGRTMKVFTDLPGVQFYAGNCISPEAGKDGAFYDKRMGFCLETQYYPNTINEPSFPSAVFSPERVYDTVTVYQFV